MTPYPIKWVKLKRYCELTGDSEDAVKSRIRRGVWLMGREIKKVDGMLRVNVERADKWVDAA